MLGTNQSRSFSSRLRRGTVWLTLIPVLLSMGMIFNFSAQSADQSNQTSGRVVTLAIRLFVPDFDRLSAARRADITHTATLIIRKLAHATEYAMLGFFLHLHSMAWRRRRLCRTAETTPPAGSAPRRGRIPWWIWGPLFGCLYAVTDELHQGFVADRAPRIGDVGIDTAGVIAGAAACALLAVIIRRIRKGNNTV